MRQLNKQEYQKRSLAIQKLVYFLELNQDKLGIVISELVSPIGCEKHPYKMDDNEFMGLIEKEIYKLENGLNED